MKLKFLVIATIIFQTLSIQGLGDDHQPVTSGGNNPTPLPAGSVPRSDYPEVDGPGNGPKAFNGNIKKNNPSGIYEFNLRC